MKKVCLRCQGVLCSRCGCCHVVACRWYVSRNGCWDLPAHPTVAQRRAVAFASLLLTLCSYERTLTEQFLAHAPRGFAERERQISEVDVILRLALECVGMLLSVEAWQVVERLLATRVAVSERKIVYEHSAEHGEGMP